MRESLPGGWLVATNLNNVLNKTIGETSPPDCTVKLYRPNFPALFSRNKLPSRIQRRTI
ncbi:MAG: hypothetical protein ACLQU1_35925 [Bryobacteraceae bacterium]